MLPGLSRFIAKLHLLPGAPAPCLPLAKRGNASARDDIVPATAPSALAGAPTQRIAAPSHTPEPPFYPALTRAQLLAWRDAADISSHERADRAVVAAVLLEAASFVPGAYPTDDFIIYQDVTFDGLVALTALPAGLRVRGDMILLGCASLAALPDGLEIEGDLSVTDCNALVQLPRGLVVTGDLDIDGAQNLHSLTPELRVLGSVKLQACPSLQHMPASMTVFGDLYLSCLPKLTTMPRKLEVRGALSMYSLTSLAAMSQSMTSGSYTLLGDCPRLVALTPRATFESLTIIKCPALSIIGADVQTTSYLSIYSCPSLVSLPRGLTVRRELRLVKCAALACLPEAMQLGGDLVIEGCGLITAVPETTYVGGTLTLRALPLLATFPSERIAAHSLVLDRCPMLTVVPDNLQRRGLSLVDCPSITSLPDLLRVDKLKLTRCAALTHLPDELVVKSLHIAACSGITRLPPGLQVRDSLRLNNCPNLVHTQDDFEQISGKFTREVYDLTERQFGSLNAYCCVFDAGTDRQLEHVNVRERPAVLWYTAQLGVVTRHAHEFCELIYLVHQMPAAERDNFVALVRPLQASAPYNYTKRLSTLADLAVALRPQQVEAWLDKDWAFQSAAEYQEITQALIDIAQWYTSLPQAGDVRVSPAQAAELSCAITLTACEELIYPVAVYTGHVMRVYEAQPLIQSLGICIQSTHGATSGRDPFSPDTPLWVAALRRVVIAPAQSGLDSLSHGLR